MIGVWLEGGNVGLREDLPIPAPREGEALVRVLLAGICATDLQMIRGYAPFAGVLGHEFVGVVDEGPDSLRGRRVVGEINAACLECPACLGGRQRHCERRTVLGIRDRDGAFAEFVCLPARNLHLVPDAVSDDAAVFVEPLAAAFRVLEQISPAPAELVLVVGDGKLGQLVARVLAASGCDTTVLGRHEEKRALLEPIGIRTTGDQPDAGSFDVAVDCTGNPDGFDVARRALRPGGTLVLKSTYAGEPRLDGSRIVVDELTVIGSRCGPFEPALAALASGTVDPTPLIAARYPLASALDALERAGRAGALKVLLDMSD